MKFFFFCAITATALSVGCAYNAGEEQVVASTIYDSEPELVVRDESMIRAERGVVVLAVENLYKKGSPYHETVQKVSRRVPYHLGTAIGNFGTGIVSAVLIPISLPIFSLSGMPARVYWKHLDTTAHNLNIAKANPPDESYAFQTPVQTSPVGEISRSEQKELERDVVVALANTKVVVTIEDPRIRFSETLVADDGGRVLIDVREQAGRIELPQGEDVIRFRVLVSCEGRQAAVETEVHIKPE